MSDHQTTPPQPATDTEKSPEQLREEIAETREHLGETVEQLAAKADVKTRAHEAIEERKQAAREEVRQTVEQARRNPAIPAAAGLAALTLLVLVVRRRRS